MSLVFVLASELVVGGVLVVLAVLVDVTVTARPPLRKARFIRKTRRRPGSTTRLLDLTDRQD